MSYAILHLLETVELRSFSIDVRAAKFEAVFFTTHRPGHDGDDHLGALLAAIEHAGETADGFTYISLDSDDYRVEGGSGVCSDLLMITGPMSRLDPDFLIGLSALVAKPCLAGDQSLPL